MGSVEKQLEEAIFYIARLGGDAEWFNNSKKTKEEQLEEAIFYIGRLDRIF